MKAIYKILNKKDAFLCVQIANSEEQALDFARMYGLRGGVKAVFVRKYYYG